MEINAKARRWGSSLAIILPKYLVEAKKIRENDEIVIDVKSKPLFVREVFGMFKGKITRPTQEIKDEMRAGWLSAEDREKEKKWKRK